MPKWARIDTNIFKNAKVQAAGNYGGQVFAGCVLVAVEMDCEDGVITPYFTLRSLVEWSGLIGLSRTSPVDGYLGCDFGMRQCIDIGLIEVHKKKGRRSKHLDMIFDHGNCPPFDRDSPEIEVIKSFERSRNRIWGPNSMAEVGIFTEVSQRNVLIKVHNLDHFQRFVIKDTSATERKRKERQRKKEAAGKTAEKMSQRDSHVTRHGSRRSTESHGDNDTEGGMSHVTCHTDPSPPDVFSDGLIGLIQKHHPDIAVDKTKCSELASGQTADLGTALKVATWAYDRSEQWSDGHHWRLVLTSPDKFWRKYPELQQQYAVRNKRKRKGDRVAPLKASETGLKLRVNKVPSKKESGKNEQSHSTT